MSDRHTKELERQLTIQTGVCKRLARDVVSYRQESAQEHAALEQLADTTTTSSSSSESEYRLKQARAAHAETLAMVADSRRRLADALPRLEELLTAARASTALTDAVSAAEHAAADARTVLEARD